MKKFWGFYKNESYSVGCNGKTVYIYDSSGKELAKFNDFPYAYTAKFKPDSNLVAIKSTAGYLGIYNLESLSLIKKIMFSKIGAQDEGFSFSPDGRFFYNIEKPVTSCRTQLSVYETKSFDRVNILFENEEQMVLDYLEFDDMTGICYILGFMRKSLSGVFDYGFVGKLDIDRGLLTEISQLDEKQYDYLHWYKDWEESGFTEKSFKWNPLNKLNHIERTSIKTVFDLGLEWL